MLSPLIRLLEKYQKLVVVSPEPPITMPWVLRLVLLTVLKVKFKRERK
jgi:hypothetical protein